MEINDVILIILSIIGVIISYGILLNMPKDFLKTFEENCKESIYKRDEKLKEKEELYKDLRKWLFK